MAVAMHASRADGHKALTHHGLELRDQPRYALGRIDDFDHDRNVEGRIFTRHIVKLPV